MKLFVGAKALISNASGQVLIVRESETYEEGTELHRWDVVGGRIENDEKLLAGLNREVYEESGLKIEVGDILGVTENFPTIKGETVHIIRVYYSCMFMGDSMVTLSSDHDRYEWIEPKDFGKYDLMEDVVELFKKYVIKYDHTLL